MRSRELSCSKSEQSGIPIGQIGGVSCALPCWRVPSEKWSSSPTGEIYLSEVEMSKHKRISFLANGTATGVEEDERVRLSRKWG
ncbi:hypothetical protein YC2023_016775 [Brassica napus]